jgi:hypothetical protein
MEEAQGGPLFLDPVVPALGGNPKAVRRRRVRPQVALVLRFIEETSQPEELSPTEFATRLESWVKAENKRTGGKLRVPSSNTILSARRLC